MRVLWLLVCLLMVSVPIYAQDHISDTSKASSETGSTRIEVDEEAGVIRFFIEGEEAMRLDARGLYVRDTVTYGGEIVDVGRVADPASRFGDADAE